MIKKIKSGAVDFIVGTHALISAQGGPAAVGQGRISFKNLGLAVIDEQHRFGVEQRKALKEKSTLLVGEDTNKQQDSEDTNKQQDVTPHFLTLSATPIPRSLSLIFYGDLQLSKILELPTGRQKIITQIVTPSGRTRIYDFVRQQISAGRQAFVVCPLIDPSDKLGVRSVTDEYNKLNNEIFKDLAIDFLHGKMKPEEKEEKMKKFLENKINIMVATSVVEVGVDAPNATVMIIEGAERFGLAQLYQFRGRVGRSEHQSYCFLFSESANEKTLRRLKALISARDCFELAERDLEFRGPGQIFGTEQSGFSDLKIASLQDVDLAVQAKAEVEQILAADKNLDKYPLLKAKVQNELMLAHLE